MTESSPRDGMQYDVVIVGAGPSVVAIDSSSLPNKMGAKSAFAWWRKVRRRVHIRWRARLSIDCAE